MSVRDLPNDKDAEQAVLAACLIDGDCYERVSCRLQASDFHYAKHRDIWTAMGHLAGRREAIDTLTLRSELDRLGTLEAIGAGYIYEMTDSLPTTTNAEYYATIIARKAVLRRVVMAGTNIAALAYDQPETVEPETVLAAAEMELQKAAGSRDSGRLITPQERANAALDNLLALREGKKPGIPYGLNGLDEILGGARPGQLVLVAGRPGTGKSALLQTVAEHMADAGKRILFCAVEMRDADLTQRSLAWLTRTNLWRIINGRFDDREFDALSSALDTVRQRQVYGYDDPLMTTASIRARALETRSRYGLDAIFVDYLQILNDDREKDNSVQRVTYISRQLLSIARSLDVPLIAASQLNRANESRNDTKPKLSDLRESGALEQDAHVVMLLHRDFSRDANGVALPEPTSCEVAKHRQGPLGQVTLRFLPKLTRYVDKDWSDAREVY